MEIVLASKSPRRRELLSRIVSDFTVLDTNADESVPDGLSPAEKVSEISIKKAQAARKLTNGESVIISADTAVFLDGVQFGKPKDKADAVRMLSLFSGKRHSVITGYTVCRGEKSITRHSETFVYFKKLSKSEILCYADTDEPYDKAGGYAIQGGAAEFIEKIDGDYTNVVGLPVNELLTALREIGLDI